MDWRPLPYSNEPMRLYVGNIEVARLCSRLDGTCYVALNQHLPHSSPARRLVNCTSKDQGRAGLEIWAARHEGRLLREVEAAWGRSKDRV